MINEDKRDDPLVNLIEVILARKLIIVIAFLSVFSVVAWGAIYFPSSWEAYTKIYIDSPTLPRVQVPYIREFGNRSFLANQVQVIKSRTILLEIIKKFNVDNTKIPSNRLDEYIDYIYKKLRLKRRKADPIEGLINYIRASTSVRLSRGSNVVQISAITSHPKFSALLANTLAKTYIDYANRFIFNKAENAYSYIEEQVENAQLKLEESEKALNEFKRQINDYSISDEISIITTKLDDLVKEYEEIQLQIENPNKQQINSHEFQALRKQSMILQDQMAELLVRHTDEHPDVKVLRKKIKNIETKLIQKQAINDNIKNEIFSKTINELKLKEKNLSNEINRRLKRRNELIKKQDDLNVKISEYQSNRRKFNALNSRLENASLFKANEIKQGTIKILDEAVPPSFPSTKKKKILFGIGTLVAIIFSLGMAFIAEYFDDSLKKPDEAEKYLKVSVLGTVPKITRKLRKI